MKKRALIFASAGLASGLISALVVERNLDWQLFVIHILYCGPIFFAAVYLAEFASNRWVVTSRTFWRIVTALATVTFVIPFSMFVFPFAAWFAQGPIDVHGSSNTNEFFGEFIFALFVSSVVASAVLTLAIWELSGLWQTRLFVSLQAANLVTLFVICAWMGVFTHWTAPKELWEVMLPLGEGLYCVVLSTVKLAPEVSGQVEKT